MKYAALGNTGVFVSRVALGAMSFGGSGSPVWDAVGALGLQETDRMVGMALDNGVNLIDTADVYAGGESEELLGQVLGRRRREVLLATKMTARSGPGPNDVGQSRLHIMRSLEPCAGSVPTTSTSTRSTTSTPSPRSRSRWPPWTTPYARARSATSARRT